MADWLAAAPETLRQALLEQIAAEIRETSAATGCYELSETVRQALMAVPRHRFVSDERQEWAYANIPLPIGRGQTISQPFIVALMTGLLLPDPAATVLEIGTGSGYQAAVLARLVRQVYSIERIPELARTAAMHGAHVVNHLIGKILMIHICGHVQPLTFNPNYLYQSKKKPVRRSEVK